MIERTPTTRMVAPRAEVEMTAEMFYARCVNCGKIIADDKEPIEATGLKPEDIKSIRVKCHHYIGKEKCNQINFVSHK